MTFFAVAISIGVFVWGLWFFGVVRVARDVITVSRGAFIVMRDTNLDDETRERSVQRASIQLFGAFASIILRSAVALLSSIVPIWFFDLAGLATYDSVAEALVRWDVIAAATLVMTVAFIVVKKL